jgi:hypothetical protein
VSTSNDDLRNRVDLAPPISIRLQDGDVFVGRFDHLEQGETEYGPAHVAVFTEPDCSTMASPPEIPEDGRASLWLLHDALLSQMRKVRPAKGERVAVKRLGAKQSGAGRDYTDYVVVTDRSELAVGWDEDSPATTGQFADEPKF